MSPSKAPDDVWIRVRAASPVLVDVFNKGQRQRPASASPPTQATSRSVSHGFSDYAVALSRSQQLLQQSNQLAERARRLGDNPGPSIAHSKRAASATHAEHVAGLIYKARSQSRTAAAASPHQGQSAEPDGAPQQQSVSYRPAGIEEPASTADPQHSPRPRISATAMGVNFESRQSLHRHINSPLHLGAAPPGLDVRVGAAIARARWVSMKVRRLMMVAKKRSAQLVQRKYVSQQATPQRPSPPSRDMVSTPIYLPANALASNTNRGGVPADTASRPGAAATTLTANPSPSSGAAAAAPQLPINPPKQTPAAGRELLADLSPAAAGSLAPPGIDGELHKQPAGSTHTGITPPAGQRRTPRRNAGAASYSSPTVASLQRQSPQVQRQMGRRAGTKPLGKGRAGMPAGNVQRQAEDGAKPKEAGGRRAAVLVHTILPESTQRLREHIRHIRTAKAAHTAAAAAAPSENTVRGQEHQPPQQQQQQQQVPAQATAGNATPAAPAAPVQSEVQLYSQQLAAVASLAAATAFGMAAAGRTPAGGAAAAAATVPAAPAPAPEAPHAEVTNPVRMGSSSQQPGTATRVEVAGLPVLVKREAARPLEGGSLPFAASPLMHMSVCGNMVVAVSPSLELTVPLKVDVDFAVPATLLEELRAAGGLQRE